MRVLFLWLQAAVIMSGGVGAKVRSWRLLLDKSAMVVSEDGVV
jgi:hypothetical protein